MSAETAPTPAPPRGALRFLSGWKGFGILYIVFLGAYLGAAGGRLRKATPYNHFSYLAHGWLAGKLEMAVSPPNENDWVKVDVLTLRDGTTVKGMFSQRGNMDRFHPLSGPSRNINPDDIVSRSYIRYVSFPPLPAVLMLPLVAAFGLQANDVIFTVVWAAMNPVLLFALLGVLRRRGHSDRTVVEDLWLTVAFGLGSVYFYSAAVGQVWHTAQVIGVTTVILYTWAALDARHPWLAGLFLGLGFATRTPLGFMFPFFLFEAVRVNGGWAALWHGLRGRTLPRQVLRASATAAVPALAVLGVLLWHNHARFENAVEFGHKYLNIAWQERIQRWGLFNYHFLARNLAAALVLLPRILAKSPYVQISQHGMSLLVTSPYLGYLVRPARKSPLALGLWLTVLGCALPSLLYQNSGFVQFGYRFSLDYMVFLVLLLALGGRRLTWLFKTLIVLAIGVNLFGAITFDRFAQFVYADSFFPHGNN